MAGSGSGCGASRPTSLGVGAYLVFLILIANQGGIIAVLRLLLVTVVGMTVFFSVREWRRAWLERKQEAAQLAAERDHVRRTVDMVWDPSLTIAKQLAIIDGFIPRLRSHGMPDPRTGPLRDRLVVVGDLTPTAQNLLGRTRRAVWVIHSSHVNRMRLLDDIANDIILPREVWEIAHLLLTQSLLAKRQQEARSAVVATAEFEAVLAPQEAALRRSIEGTMQRIAILEEYARRVQEADAALLAQEMLGDNEQYRNLLARTDDVEGIRQLTYQAAAASEVLAKSVREAIEVGQRLIPPEGSP